MRNIGVKPVIYEPSVTIAVGCKDSNVTVENKRHINRYIRKRKNEGRDYRVLIVDFSNEYNGTKIDINQIGSFTNKVCTIGSSVFSIKQMNVLLATVCLKFTDGLLVINNYHRLGMTNNLRHSLIGLTSCNRTNSVDIILSTQTFKFISPELIQNTSFIRLHKTVDDIYRYSSLFYNPELFALAHRIQSKFENSKKPIIIDTENVKIFGCSSREFFRGVSSYISDKISRFRSLSQLNEFSIQEHTYHFDGKKYIPISNKISRYKK